MSDYGLTLLGFKVKQQSQIISEWEESLRQKFGQNINLAAESVFGEIVGIASEREALIWSLLEAVALSQYPNGAEGTSVDNILALNNLRRLAAAPTRTSPAILGVDGLLLYGTQGTVCTQKSIISPAGRPDLQFTLDADYTLLSAVNEVQRILLDKASDAGTFKLRIVDNFGNTLTTTAMNPVHNTYFDLWGDKTILSSEPAPSTGNFKLNLSLCGTVTQIVVNAPVNLTTLRDAIRAAGYPAATLTGGFSGSGCRVSWGSLTQPLVTISDNTTGVTITAVNSLQANVNNLLDSVEAVYPFTDLSATGTLDDGYIITFGANPVNGSNPPSGGTDQNMFTSADNTLTSSGDAVTILFIEETKGHTARASGFATCTQNGPNVVDAGALTIIGTPISGWDSVTNPLDCVAGRLRETDAEALLRRDQLLVENASGPLFSIIGKLRLLTGVTTAAGYQNLGVAARQLIYFPSEPTSGQFRLTVGTQQTALLDYDATAAEVQAAISDLIGYETTLVAGIALWGYIVDFNGSNGGQSQSLIQISDSTLDNAPVTKYSLPGKAMQFIVEGGSKDDIVDTIYGNKSGGIQVYAEPVICQGDLTTGEMTVLNVTNTENLAAGIMVYAPGIPLYTTLVSIQGGTVTLSNAATATAEDVVMQFVNQVNKVDDYDNVYPIQYQRPLYTQIFIKVELTTDLLVNGQPNPNAKFQVGSIPTIKEDLVTIGEKVGMGETIIGFGTDGLIGAFNDVEGIVSYTLYFGVVDPPTQNTNIALPPWHKPLFDTSNVSVSYT